jgi:hypothetical protein
MQRYSARPDGKRTLDEIIRLIPEGERVKIEDAFNSLLDGEGYGEISLVVVRGQLVTWKLEVSRKI